MYAFAAFFLGQPGSLGEYFSRLPQSEMQLVQSEAQNKLKASLDSALNAVAKEKGLGAVLIKDAVPQGGVDVTDSVIEKMK